MSRLGTGLAVLIAAGAATAQPLPSNEQFETILLRDVQSSNLLRTGCESIARFKNEESEFDFENPFRTVLRFASEPAPTTSPGYALVQFRALARAGLLREERGPDRGAIQFRVTEKGWAQIRPRNGLCFDWGTYDQLRVLQVRLAEPSGDRRWVNIEYEVSFSSTEVLEPWARDPAVRRDLRILSFYVKPQKYPERASETPQGWRAAPRPMRTPPQITEREVLDLVRARIPEAAATEACFPLPRARPQLGIETTPVDGYSVTILERDRLNRTQQAFIAQTLEELADYARSGILTRVSERSFRLRDRLKPRYRNECLAVGTNVARVVKARMYSWYDNDAWFKLKIEVQPDAQLDAALASHTDVRRFMNAGSVCEGWLKHAGGWNISNQRCYPAY